MLAEILEPEWAWQFGDWGSFDFAGPNGIGLEVKQSAARQQWHHLDSRSNQGRFDIAARTGRWEQRTWVPEPGRAASIYVLAWHPIVDLSVADQRVAEQWEFYVLPASRLPDQKSVSLSAIRNLAEARPIDGVKAEVQRLALP